MIIVPDLLAVQRTATSDAERRLAGLFAQVDGGLDAVVFHSVKLRSHEYKQQAEADFVVLWKGVVVVIEVKGGGVRKHEGSWYSIDRRKDWHRLSGSPMEQARTAAFALRDILQEDGASWFAHEAVVVTPDIDAPDTSVEWHATHWWARDSMTVVGLRAALDIVAAGARTAPREAKVARTADLRVRLFGEFTRMPVIDAQRGAILEEQSRATHGQSAVLASLARCPRLVVHGGAGTGKSLLLIEAAKQEADQGRHVLVTFRSHHLAGLFESHLQGRPIDVLAFDDIPAGRQWDVVLVDEAQDLMTAADMDQLDSVLVGGRAGGRWRLFLDQNNQAHVDGTFDADTSALVLEEAVPVDLIVNVRNTRAIVNTVQSYLGADVGDPGIVQGERVTWHEVPGPAGVEAAKHVAERLVAGGLHRSDICIIRTSSRVKPSRVASGFLVTSPRWIKGLEADHVVVCDLPTEFDDAGLAAFYVAVTRARVSLHIVLGAEDKLRLQRLVRKVKA